MKAKLAALGLTLLLLLSGCGGKGAAPYTPSMADDLLASGAFEGSEMAPVDLDIVTILYGVGSAVITDGVCYMAANSSASADELTILVLTDEEAAIAAEAAFHERVASQIAACRDYCPAAIPRLEGAVVSRRGNTVLLAVGHPDLLAAYEGIG